MKRSITAPLFLSIAMTEPEAYAASSPEDSELTAAVPYTYGMPLEIAKVISIESAHTDQCQVIESRMTFLDDVGMRRVITYLEQSDACFVGD